MTMPITFSIRLASTYLAVFCAMLLLLYLVPVAGGYIWEPVLINSALALLFTLLVWLVARLAKTNGTVLGVVVTALFVLFFCPGGERFFQRDEVGLSELASQCMVPFFMGQFQRIRTKDFRNLYALMLLMGIFCSYTHDGITIPMCCAFVVVSLRNRNRFFRMACWPMVTGVVIGTCLSIWHHLDDDLTMATDLRQVTTFTSIALQTLWDTKIFVISLALTGYLMSWRGGRKMLLFATRRHFLVSLCTAFSLVSIPFAPLGIDNAVQGVCFFSMFWTLFMSRYLLLKYTGKRL